MNYSELDCIVQKIKLDRLLHKHQFRYEVYKTLREMEKALPQKMSAVYEAYGKFKEHIYSKIRRNNSIDKFYQFLLKKVDK